MASNSEVASPAAPMDALARSVTGNREDRLSVPVTDTLNRLSAGSAKACQTRCKIESIDRSSFGESRMRAAEFAVRRIEHHSVPADM